MVKEKKCHILLLKRHSSSSPSGSTLGDSSPDRLGSNNKLNPGYILKPSMLLIRQNHMQGSPRLNPRFWDGRGGERGKKFGEESSSRSREEQTVRLQESKGLAGRIPSCPGEVSPCNSLKAFTDCKRRSHRTGGGGDLLHSMPTPSNVHLIYKQYPQRKMFDQITGHYGPAMLTHTLDSHVTF